MWHCSTTVLGRHMVKTFTDLYIKQCDDMWLKSVVDKYMILCWTRIGLEVQQYY